MVQKPRILAILGGSGSGKTTWRQRLLQQPKYENYLYLGLDDIMMAMPEYQEMAKVDPASAVHTYEGPATELTIQKLNDGLSAGKDMLVDNTGARPYIMNFLQEGMRRGFFVEAHALTIDVLSAHIRAVRRESFRYSVPEVLEQKHAGFSQLFLTYALGSADRRPLDRIALFDSSNMKMRMIARYEQGRLIDEPEPTLLKKFLAKGSLDTSNAEVRRAIMATYAR